MIKPLTQTHRTAVCTLFEANDLPGCCSLANSLARGGFAGTFVAGTRAGAPWLGQLKEIFEQATADPEVEFKVVIREIDHDMHFTNYKPCLMDSLFDDEDPALANIDAVLFFDPDIVLAADWSFFEHWVQHGVALSGDLNWLMIDDHPHRHAWRKHAESLGYQAQRKLDYYFNGGFCGVTRNDRGFVRLWAELVDSVAEVAGGLKAFRAKPRTQPFQSANQDTLNLAAMIWDGQLSTLGPEGMGFGPGYHPMGHSLGRPKPWEKSYLFRALKGRGPQGVDRLYWDRASGPFKIHSNPRITRTRIDLALADGVSRFLKKP